MNTRSEWQAANQELMAEQRRQLGEPPTSEEVLAYLRGALPADEEERVRNLLVCYPELARALAEPFPEDDPRPGDADYVSDAELARRWSSLRKQLPDRERVRRFPQAWMALAAALALVFAGLYFREAAKSRQLLQELASPRVLSEEQWLSSGGRRGAPDSGTTVSAQRDFLLLAISLMNEPHFENYRLEIVDADAKPPQRVWSSTALPRPDDDALRIIVPRTFLEPGEYQVVLYGVLGAGDERVGRYSLRVSGVSR